MVESMKKTGFKQTDVGVIPIDWEVHKLVFVADIITKRKRILSIDEIKTIVVDKKWMHSMEPRIRTEMDNISHRLTQRIKELAERYEMSLPHIEIEINDLEKKVSNHMGKMGFTWK